MAVSFNIQFSALQRKNNPIMLFWGGALTHAATQRLEKEWIWRCSIFPNLKKDSPVVQLGSTPAVCEDEPKQAFILLGWVPTPEKIVQYRLQCRRQPWKTYKAVLTSQSSQADCSWCFRQLVQSYSSAWADLTPSDYSIDIPKKQMLEGFSGGKPGTIICPYLWDTVTLKCKT